MCAKVTSLRDDAKKVILSEKGRSLTYIEVIGLWITSFEFRNFFISFMTKTPYPAYHWETAPLTIANRNQYFEFVLIKNTLLERLRADSSAFSEHFAKTSTSVVCFSNLSKSSLLLVPLPLSNSYAHLAAFNKTAPLDQQHELWQLVGNTVKQRLSTKALYLSTAGLGVPWLHIRLDSKPKYYKHKAYKK